LSLNGVNFIEKQVESLKELAKDYDIIMNCTGLGAQTLCKDNRMIPIKGQVIKVTFYPLFK